MPVATISRFTGPPIKRMYASLQAPSRGLDLLIRFPDLDHYVIKRP